LNGSRKAHRFQPIAEAGLELAGRKETPFPNQETPFAGWETLFPDWETSFASPQNP
jgi:hypothetical protein